MEGEGSEGAPERMAALSIAQPYATSIARGIKTCEYRSWKTSYRGPLLIAATQRPVVRGMPNGVAVGIVELADCVANKQGGYTWELRHAREIKPFAVKGHLGLYTVTLPQGLEAETP
jgi:hypothetical protein